VRDGKENMKEESLGTGPSAQLFKKLPHLATLLAQVQDSQV